MVCTVCVNQRPSRPSHPLSDWDRRKEQKIQLALPRGLTSQPQSMASSNQFSLKREPYLRTYVACFGSTGFVVRQYLDAGIEPLTFISMELLLMLGISIIIRFHQRPSGTKEGTQVRQFVSCFYCYWGRKQHTGQDSNQGLLNFGKCLVEIKPLKLLHGDTVRLSVFRWYTKASDDIYP